MSLHPLSESSEAVAEDPDSPSRSFAREACWFVWKQIQACVFPGLFFLAVFAVPRAGWFGIPRYDVLLVLALAIQVWMIATGRETRDELKTICLFHVLGFILEVFKTSDAIGSWSYPDFGYSKILGVPLFAGFMYAAVGSYVIQAWRLFDLRIRHHPPHLLAGLIAAAIYLNFFTHHFIGDYRWYLAAVALGLYARSTVVFRPHRRDFRMPLLLSMVAIGFFIWLAENLGTLFRLWSYPHQLGAWSVVKFGKWTAWSMLVLITFTLVTNLKHLKARIHVAQ